MVFTDKIVWITGASSGIGEQLAYAFSKAGAFVILSARSKSELERVQRGCTFPEKTHIALLDIADYSQVEEVGKQLLAQYGFVDILVNNAGISQRSLVKDTVFAVDKKLIEVDLLGTIAVTKTVFNVMLQRGQGSIVTVTSVVGKIGTPMRSSYSAAKHGLHGFFDSLRAEVPNNKPHIMLVCPGFVKTKVSINALTGDGSRQGTMDTATGKGLSPEYVAHKILQGIRRQKEEIYIAGAKEKLGIYLKRFFPTLFSRLIRRMKVT